MQGAKPNALGALLLLLLLHIDLCCAPTQHASRERLGLGRTMSASAGIVHIWTCLRYSGSTLVCWEMRCPVEAKTTQMQSR